MAEERISYYNGEFVPDSQCVIHISDRGFLRGDTVFDVARTFNGKPYRVRDHLERLYRSMTFARIDPGMTIDEMEVITLDVAKRNEHLREPGGDFAIWQTITRGYANTFAKVNDPGPDERLHFGVGLRLRGARGALQYRRPRRVPAHSKLFAPIPRAQAQAL